MPQRRKVVAQANSSRSGLSAQGLGGKLGGRFGLMAGGETDRGRKLGPTGPRANRGNDSGSASRRARREQTGLKGRTALGFSLEPSHREGYLKSSERVGEKRGAKRRQQKLKNERETHGSR